jgi:hypothetical protein
MFSRREREGELIIDHRDSPGISHEEAARVGRGIIPVPGGTRFHSATYNCSHCEALVVLNPKRTRPRHYCAKCDSDICDLCEAERVRTGKCRPFKQVIDEFIDQIEKGKTWHAEP